nr:MAG TPA: hypothetical protein [Caudoviricetes sp.]
MCCYTPLWSKEMWERAHPPKCHCFESRFEKSERLSSMKITAHSSEQPQ